MKIKNLRTSRLSWLLFIARRYFGTKRRERGHIASILSILGIAVGVMTLIAVLGVMNGFQLGTISDILEINSYHLRILQGEQENGAEGRSRMFNDTQFHSRLRSVQGVQAVLPFLEIQALCKRDGGSPQIIVIRAVPEDSRERDPGLIEQLSPIAGRFVFTDPRSIIVGRELAAFLGAGVGDTVDIVNVSGSDFNVLKPVEERFVISGIFESGMYEFDLSWAYISLTTARKVFPDGGEAVIGIKLENRFADRQALKHLETVTEGEDVSTETWREYNRSIFSALRLEKLIMTIFLALIFVVVGFNIHQSLKRSVMERTEEIGTLKALGAPAAAIRLIFIFEGLFIGLLGGFFGVVSGLLVSSNIDGIFSAAESLVNGVMGAAAELLRPFIAMGREETFSLFSPAYFYLTEVPSKVLFSEVAAVFLFAFLSSCAAAFFASRRVSKIEPSRVLRYE
jgi:lipoprotein-releasing system permease protein